MSVPLGKFAAASVLTRLRCGLAIALVLAAPAAPAGIRAATVRERGAAAPGITMSTGIRAATVRERSAAAPGITMAAADHSAPSRNETSPSSTSPPVSGSDRFQTAEMRAGGMRAAIVAPTKVLFGDIVEVEIRVFVHPEMQVQLLPPQAAEEWLWRSAHADLPRPGLENWCWRFAVRLEPTASGLLALPDMQLRCEDVGPRVSPATPDSPDVGDRSISPAPDAIRRRSLALPAMQIYVHSLLTEADDPLRPRAAKLLSVTAMPQQRGAVYWMLGIAGGILVLLTAVHIWRRGRAKPRLTPEAAVLHELHSISHWLTVSEYDAEAALAQTTQALRVYLRNAHALDRSGAGLAAALRALAADLRGAAQRTPAEVAEPATSSAVAVASVAEHFEQLDQYRFSGRALQVEQIERLIAAARGMLERLAALRTAGAEAIGSWQVASAKGRAA